MPRQFRTTSSRLVLPAIIAALLPFAAAAPANAEVHTFKALSGKHKAVKRSHKAVKRFRVVGVDANAVVNAHLVTRHRRKRVSVAAVRRAARSRRHLLRATANHGGGGTLKVITAPETTITGGPEEGSETTSTSAEFFFSSSSPVKATFYCSLDGSPSTKCSSGFAYSSLTQGSHHFTVYAVDRYGTPDPTPATRSWTIVSPPSHVATSPDTTAPDTSITSESPADGSSTTSTYASFSFTGTDNAGVVSYECSLDSEEFSACTSPKSYGELSVGSHTFRVVAKDGAGNVDPTPAARTWTITAPDSSVYTVPSSVPSGCSTDATGQILSWIASVPDNSTISFGQGGCYRIEGTLELRNRTLTVEGNGATFRSFNSPEDQRAIWRLWNSTITLRNLSIVGSYANGGVFNASLEHSHGIDLRGTHAIIENVSASNLGGDCVYFGLGATRSSGAVRGGSCEKIGRNAVSVTAGENIRVENVTTDRIGYITFDVEPNAAAGSGASQVVFDANTIGSYYMKAYTVIGNAPVIDQEFINNRVVGQGLKIGVVNGTYRPQQLRIGGNSSDTAVAPAAMNFDGIEGLVVSGNTVAMTSGTMASVDSSCGVNISGNSYPGGSNEASITNSTTPC